MINIVEKLVKREGFEYNHLRKYSLFLFKKNACRNVSVLTHCKFWV